MSKPLSLLILLLALCPGMAFAASSPDLIVHNGKVFTSDPDNLWAEAVAVRGNRIQAVGGNADVLALAGPRTEILDLGGRTVIPGLNDAHVHALVPQGLQLNVPTFVPGPGPSLPEVLDMIARAAAANPPGTWLFATVGTAFGDDPQAHRFSLDQVAPNHPVKLEIWTGHGMYLNTKGLQTLGIAENEPDPFGGFYERVPGTDVLNGVVHEYAEHLVRGRFAKTLSKARIGAVYQQFAESALRHGYTSVQDMAIGVAHKDAVKILNKLNLPLRWREICFPLTPGEPCYNGATTKLVTASGIKWITDGTPIERLAFMTEPYVDRPSTQGRFNFPDEDFEEMVERGLFGPIEKRQLLFHAVGDGAIGKVLDQMEALAPAAHWRSRRARIEHGDLIAPADVERARDLGVVVVQNPTHLTLAQVLVERYGPDILTDVQPLRTLVETGVPLAFGTDGIGTAASPFVDILLAVLHLGRPSEALTREQAVMTYTTGSAYAEFEERRKGRLAPGMLADLAVLSQDIFTVPLDALPATESVLTVVDGEIAWDAGVL